ncbi:hypothetical protein KI387_002449, partial [Taxus chinensis]
MEGSEAIARVTMLLSLWLLNFCNGDRCPCEICNVNTESCFFSLLKRAWKLCARRRYNCMRTCCVPIRVGEHRHTKFMIPISFINHPLFANLLEDAGKVYGFEYKGCLRIP